MIELRNISKTYHTKERQTEVLKDINLQINSGDFLAIMGPSGSGKSTLLNIIGLLDDFDHGLFQFDGTQIGEMNNKDRKKFAKGKIGFIFQNFNLLEDLTVYENIELPLLYQKVAGKTRKQKVDEVLERLQIKHRSKHFPSQLSGGQQQRTAIARAIINTPSIILADEPTGNLDSANGHEVMEILNELNTQGTTVAMVTHSQTFANKCNRRIKLLDGKIISENLQQNIL